MYIHAQSFSNFFEGRTRGCEKIRGEGGPLLTCFIAFLWPNFKSLLKGYMRSAPLRPPPPPAGLGRYCQPKTSYWRMLKRVLCNLLLNKFMSLIDFITIYLRKSLVLFQIYSHHLLISYLNDLSVRLNLYSSEPILLRNCCQYSI